ncbi:hypothetical protein B296_00043103, partial [Ensete ventricosum]
MDGTCRGEGEKWIGVWEIATDEENSRADNGEGDGEDSGEGKSGCREGEGEIERVTLSRRQSRRFACAGKLVADRRRK